MTQGERAERFDPDALEIERPFLKSSDGVFYYVTGRRYYRLSKTDLEADKIKVENRSDNWGIINVLLTVYIISFVLKVTGSYHHGLGMLLVNAAFVFSYLFACFSQIFITKGLVKMPVRQSWRNFRDIKARFLGTRRLFLNAAVLMVFAGYACVMVNQNYHAYKYSVQEFQRAVDRVKNFKPSERDLNRIRGYYDGKIDEKGVAFWVEDLRQTTIKEMTVIRDKKKDVFYAVIAWIPGLVLSLLASLWAFYMGFALHERNRTGKAAG